MSQQRLLPGVDPDELIVEAKAEHQPVATVCLFSGGDDSTVLAHRCRDHYDQLAFIDTGTAVPGVRDFVESYALWLGKPLVVLEAGAQAYRKIVLGEQHARGTPKGFRPYGFPDAPGHQRVYSYLKEPQLRKLRAQCQDGHPHGSRVLMLTGIRRKESKRRKGRPETNRHGAIVFANPLIDWTSEDMWDYRGEHRLPRSDVAALLHRSGECNCGAFARPGDREMLAALWPEWFEETIASLEREAEQRGIACHRWGHGGSQVPVADAGPLCSDCQLQLDGVGR